MERGLSQRQTKGRKISLKSQGRDARSRPKRRRRRNAHLVDRTHGPENRSLLGRFVLPTLDLTQ